MEISDISDKVVTEQNQSQSRLAYLCLENLIVTQALPPGANVTERQLIARSGYGRTPVREAIQRLEWEQLIEVRPRAGLRIAAIVPEHGLMVLEIRRRLEPLAARLAAEHIPPAIRDDLVECAKAMTESTLTDDRNGFLVSDKTFDEILQAACPNPFLAQSLGPLQTHSRRHWFHNATSQSLALAVDLHVQVIRALIHNDPPEAERRMSMLVDGMLGES